MKRVLITGKNSYIGESLYKYLKKFSDYKVDIIKTKGLQPKAQMLKGYDSIINVAGIAHIKETKENRELYFKVNRDLAVDIAKEAKKACVNQYILLSTMSVYGKTTGHISKSTKPAPSNAYGQSKFEADEKIAKMTNDKFKFVCLRPPMVYGKGCKGNYQKLRKIAIKSPLFPSYKNERSMIYIGNLCAFIKNAIDSDYSGLYFPQNSEYASTAKIVRMIAKNNGKKIIFTPIFNPAINILKINTIKKVFGNLTYEKVDTIDDFSLEESIKLTEAAS